MITQAQKKKIVEALSAGLSSIERPVPKTLSEWANENFYLSSESSYHEGRWHTIPFQKAIMNAMGNDDIRVIDFIKSARVGYSKMLLACIGYNTEHKKRNQLLWQATDGAAKDFMKSQVDTMIRDVPAVLDLSPWHGMKHGDNTQENKVFANRKQLYVKGGASAKNYREKSVDAVFYDELSSFEPNVEKEGSPTSLGDKRTEGSAFRKSIRGSTPKIKGECLISLEAETSPHFFRRFVPCPHCGEMQFLKFGGKNTPYGFKWEKGKPETVFYQCEHNGCVIENNQLSKMDSEGVYQSESGLKTEDGIRFYHSETGALAPTPARVAFHIWTAYSPMTTWAQIVSDWYEAQGDTDKIRTFVNTTLGEAWEEERGERIEPKGLMARVEDYDRPDAVTVTVAGVDTQDDRLEATVYEFAENGECWGIEHLIVPGDTTKIEVHNEMARELSELGVVLGCQDAMGHSTDTVYASCQRRRWLIPIKGIGGSRSFIDSKKARAKRLRKKRKKEMAPEPVGVDQGKAILHSRLNSTEHGPHFIHFNRDDSFDDEFFQQLTAEVIQKRRKGGRVESKWVSLRERNEALDCWIYAYAAFLMAKESSSIKFGQRGARKVAATKKKTQSGGGGRLF